MQTLYRTNLNVTRVVRSLQLSEGRVKQLVTFERAMKVADCQSGCVGLGDWMVCSGWLDRCLDALGWWCWVTKQWS